MSKYLERTNASKPTFGDYVTIEMKCYGVPNEYFIHDVMTHPFTSNSWRNVPIDARDPEEHLHDMSETVISVCTQGFHLSGWHIFNVRLSDVLPMKGDKWAWQESPLRTRIAELEATVEIHADISNAYEKRISEIVSLSNKANAKLQSRIAELEAAQRWIPVSERLPEIETDRVLIRRDNIVALGWIYFDELMGDWDWRCYDEDWDGNPTHWMLLPKLSEVQE